MECPGTSIFQDSEGLHLDTSVQHLEEDEAEEDRKHRNKEVPQPVPCSVCVSDILIIFNTYCFSVHQLLYSSHQYYVTFTFACLVYILIFTRIQFCECQEMAELVCFNDLGVGRGANNPSL